MRFADFGVAGLLAGLARRPSVLATVTLGAVESRPTRFGEVLNLRKGVCTWSVVAWHGDLRICIYLEGGYQLI